MSNLRVSASLPTDGCSHMELSHTGVDMFGIICILMESKAQLFVVNVQMSAVWSSMCIGSTLIALSRQGSSLRLCLL